MKKFHKHPTHPKNYIRVGGSIFGGVGHMRGQYYTEMHRVNKLVMQQLLIDPLLSHPSQLN
jgi:hypothetical protein